MEDNKIPGKGQAIAALVLGIVSIVFSWFGYGALIGLACGVVGLILAMQAKKQGFTGGMYTAGLVLSIIGLALSAILFISCAACTGCAACGYGSLASFY